MTSRTLSLSLFALAACSGCVSHPSTMAKVKSAVVLPAPPVYADGVRPFGTIDPKEKDAILMHEERGRARQIEGDAEGSAADYEAAAALYAELDEKPVVSLSDSASGGTAYLLNDLVLKYEGNAHERTMVRTLDAFNRIAMHDWDGVGVDMRNMVYESERELEKNEKLLEEAREASEKDGKFKTAAMMDEFLGPSAPGAAAPGSCGLTRGKGVDPVSETLVEAHQNGYSWYLAGFWSEMEGRWSDAALAYGRVGELAPDAATPGADAARALAARESESVEKDGTCDVAVFFEEGWAPVLKSADIRFVVGNVSAAFVFPYYPKSELDDSPSPLVVSDGESRILARTECVADFRRNAFRAWRDRAPYVITRAAIRSSAKAIGMAAANIQARKRGNGAYLASWLFSVIFTQATEIPDLRSWNLAPRYGQIARFKLEPGPHELTFEHGFSRKTVEVDVPEDGAIAIHAVAVPGFLSVDATGISFDAD